MSRTEPRNPFYLLLLVASLAFVATALAYGLVPVLEQKGLDAGQALQPLPFSHQLRIDGWKWLLYELAAMTLFGVLSMGLDRVRSLKKEREAATIPPSQHSSPAP